MMTTRIWTSTPSSGANLLIPEMVMVIIMIRASTNMHPVHNRLLVNQRLDEMKTALEPVCLKDFDTKPSLKYLLSFFSNSLMIFTESVSSGAMSSSGRCHPGWLTWRQTLRSATSAGEQIIIFLSSDRPFVGVSWK